MIWGDAKTYSWLWSVSGPTYKNELMFWLQTENPSLYQLTLKEIGRVSPQGNSPPQGKAHRRSGKGDSMALPDVEGAPVKEGLQDLGFDIQGERMDDQGHREGED